MDITTSPADADRLVRTALELAGSRVETAAVLRSSAFAVPEGASGDATLDLAITAFRQAWSGAIDQLAHDAQVLAGQIRLVDAQYADTELHLTRALAATAGAS